MNYLGGVWMTRSLLPGLQSAARAGRGHIVNVVSIAGAVAFAPSGAYTASKHAQLAFSRSLQASLRGSGIDVSSVGKGTATVTGNPDGVDPGDYSVNGAKWQQLPLLATTFAFGTAS